jgi:hypothetical protein
MTTIDAKIDYVFSCGNAKITERKNEKIDYNALCKKAWLVHGEVHNYSPKRLGVGQMNRYVDVLLNGSEDEIEIILSKGFVRDNFFTMLDYMIYILDTAGFYLVDKETTQFYYSVVTARCALYYDISTYGFLGIDYSELVRQSFTDLQNNSKCKDIEKLILVTHDLNAFVRT